MESNWSACIAKVSGQLKALNISANEPLWRFLCDIAVAVRRLEATTALPPLQFEDVTDTGLAAKFFSDLRKAAGMVPPCPETRSIRNRTRYALAALGAIRSGIPMADRRPLVRNRTSSARSYEAPESDPQPFWLVEKLAGERDSDLREARRKKGRR